MFFRVKWLRPAMKVPRVCSGCGCGRTGRDWFLPVFCNELFSCVRSSLRFLTLWLQVAVYGLHDRCRFVLPCVSRDAGLDPDVAKRIVSGCMDVTWASFWGNAGAGNFVCFFG